MKPIILTLTTLLCLAVTFNDGAAQVAKPDNYQIVIPGFEKYKKDRKAGKVFQLVGGLGLTTYFILSKTHQTAVRDGSLNANPPPLALPITASAVMTIGFAIDMGAVEHLFKRKRPEVRVSTENYEF